MGWFVIMNRVLVVYAPIVFWLFLPIQYSLPVTFIYLLFNSVINLNIYSNFPYFYSSFLFKKILFHIIGLIVLIFTVVKFEHEIDLFKLGGYILITLVSIMIYKGFLDAKFSSNQKIKIKKTLFLILHIYLWISLFVFLNIIPEFVSRSGIANIFGIVFFRNEGLSGVESTAYCFFIFVLYAFQNKNKLYIIGPKIDNLILIANMITTISKVGLVFVLIYLVIKIFEFQNIRKSVMVLVISLMMVATFINQLLEFTDYYFSAVEGSTDGRIELWIQGIEKMILEQYPIYFGFGYRSPQLIFEGTGMHSTFLQLYFEYGLLSIYFIFITLSFVKNMLSLCFDSFDERFILIYLIATFFSSEVLNNKIIIFLFFTLLPIFYHLTRKNEE